MPQSRPQARGGLDRDRIVDGAVALADDIGLDHLGVRPMTIYHYVKNKDDIVDGMVGRVFDEVERPSTDVPWKDAIASRARSLREALRRHPWAIPIMESRRTPGSDILDHHEALMSVWLSTGFPLAVVAHGLVVVDAFVYGFALQEAALPLGGGGGDLAEASDQIIAPLSAEAYPSLLRFTAEYVMQPGYDFRDSFEAGLGIVLDGIERRGVEIGGRSRVSGSSGADSSLL